MLPAPPNHEALPAQGAALPALAFMDIHDDASKKPAILPNVATSSSPPTPPQPTFDELMERLYRLKPSLRPLPSPPASVSAASPSGTDTVDADSDSM